MSRLLASFKSKRSAPRESTIDAISATPLARLRAL